MSRWFLAFCPLLTALTACSGSAPDPDPNATDDTNAVDPTGTAGAAGASATSGGSSGSGGTISTTTQQGGSNASAGAGGGAIHADAASPAEGGPVEHIATLPLPA